MVPAPMGTLSLPTDPPALLIQEQAPKEGPIFLYIPTPRTEVGT